MMATSTLTADKFITNKLPADMQHTWRLAPRLTRRLRSGLGVLVLALAACSGGGSDGGSGNDGSTTALSGTGFKGIVRAGQVSLYSVTNGQKDTLVATATTDDNGSFSLSVPASVVNTLLWAELRGADDNSTLVQCDMADCGRYDGAVAYDLNGNGVVDIGEWMVVGSDFLLTAWVANASRDSTISINPVTHAVAAQFSTAPEPNELEAVYRSVQAALGLTLAPESLLPVDVTASAVNASVLQNQLLIAAVAALYDGAADTTLAERLLAITTNGSSEPVQDQSLTRLSQLALLAAAGLPDSVQSTVSAELQTINATAAADEQQLSADELPLMPPALE